MSYPNEEDFNLLVDMLPEKMLEQIVFVGGAIVGLFLDEVGQSKMRPTLDTDFLVNVRSLSDYYKFADKIKELGFKPSQEAGDPPYRYRKDVGGRELLIDVMVPEEKILGFTNAWYKPGMRAAIEYRLSSGKTIKVFDPVFLLATKIEAFKGRGIGSPIDSDDLEDIVAIIESGEGIVEKIKSSEAGLKKYVVGELKAMVENTEIAQAMEGQAMNSEKAFENMRIILQK